MLPYLDRELSQKEKRRTIKLMKQYKKLGAIIESKEIKATPKHTVEFKEKTSQASNQFHSEVEDIVLARLDIENYVRIREVLDLAYNSVTPLQQEIWDEHFIDGLPDKEVYYGRSIARKTYYVQKSELIKIVAECLRVAQIGNKKGT